MKKLYATLFSALVVGCAVCAGCTTKKVSSSAEVVDIIHKVLEAIGLCKHLSKGCLTA